MTALAAASMLRPTRQVHLTADGKATVGTGATVYPGSMIVMNETTGRAVAGTAAAGRTFLGRSRGTPVEGRTAVGNTAGTVVVEYDYNFEIELARATALTKAYIGCSVAILDDNTVTTGSAAGTAGVRVYVGEAIEFENAGKVWVALRKFGSKTAP